MASDNYSQRARLGALESLLHQKKTFMESFLRQGWENCSAAELHLQLTSRYNPGGSIDALVMDIRNAENRQLAQLKNADELNNSIYTRLNLVLSFTLVTLVVMAFWLVRKNIISTERTRNQLENHKQLLQSIIDNTNSVIYVKDMLGRLSLVNSQYEQVYSGTGLQPAHAADEAVLGSGKMMESQEEVMVGDRIRHFYTIRFPLVNRNGEVYAMVGISTDVTGLIIQQQLQQQKAILENSVAAREKERKQIGMELHDNINQLLASAKLMLDTALGRAENNQELLQEARNNVYTAISEARKLSHSLMPDSFRNTPLSGAIADLLQGIRLSGQLKARMKCNSKRQLDALDSRVKLALYRIIQEQVSNVLKYSNATRLMVDLQLSTGYCQLIVSDNGRGFDPQAVRQGIGFHNIADRVDANSGTWQVLSAPGEGCELVVGFPT